MLFGVLVSVAVLAMVMPSLTGMVANLKLEQRRNVAAATPTTTAPPAPTIKPVSVRPVLSGFVTTPPECPPATPAPPDQPMRVCDFAGTAVYELAPEALRVDLTHVDSIKNPLTGVEMVQMTMTPDSARQFGTFSTGQVGKQVAFVRGGTVVWAPKITTPIDGQVLQLSGDLTAEQATQLANMLRDQT